MSDSAPPFFELSVTNLERQHICCAIASQRQRPCRAFEKLLRRELAD